MNQFDEFKKTLKNTFSSDLSKLIQYLNEELRNSGLHSDLIALKAQFESTRSDGRHGSIKPDDLNWKNNDLRKKLYELIDDLEKKDFNKSIKQIINDFNNKEESVNDFNDQQLTDNLTENEQGKTIISNDFIVNPQIELFKKMEKKFQNSKWFQVRDNSTSSNGCLTRRYCLQRIANFSVIRIEVEKLETEIGHLNLSGNHFIQKSKAIIKAIPIYLKKENFYIITQSEHKLSKIIAHQLHKIERDFDSFSKNFYAINETSSLNKKILKNNLSDLSLTMNQLEGYLLEIGEEANVMYPLWN